MMVPGLSEADCQVAGFHYRQLLAEGQRQQVVAGVRQGSVGNRAVFVSLREQVGARLARVGQLLQLGLAPRATTAVATGPR